MRWREIPVDARRYILYHTIISPLLITWYMLPMYMFMTGYSVLEIGAIFTLVHVLSIPATYIVGKIFDKIAIRHGLVLIDALEGVSYILYGLAYGPIAPLMLFLGLLIGDIAGIFYPLYQATERILYPENKIEEIFAWHIRLPEISQLIGFLVLGYIFGHVLNTPYHYRVGFVVFGLVSILTVFYLLRFLPRLNVEERISAEKFEFKVDNEFRLILVLEALTTLAWSMAPEIVLLNYVVNVLGLTLFEAMVVEAAISVGAIAATYISEKIGSKHRFKAIALGYILISLWALIMYMNPPFILVVAAYLIARFGDILAFPFYRSWIFSKIPKEKASSILSALSSYRRLIALASPALAGLLASIRPTLPYLASLMFFLASSLVLIEYGSKLKEMQ
ncbi:MFS transporter [Pyrofollis japonicus]|uniref:MFS transporter n=1 Tax=Pyrofollis japonicus TaxID=3060460 RepID=UPI00295C041F|nr:MFS transporter [Pyrofollis japonicus]BEP18087.1 MFS transporter [Pyrofollis japonicus]